MILSVHQVPAETGEEGHHREAAEMLDHSLDTLLCLVAVKHGGPEDQHCEQQITDEEAASILSPEKTWGVPGDEDTAEDESSVRLKQVVHRNPDGGRNLQEVNNGWGESQAGEALYEVHEEDEAHHRANRPLVFSSSNAGTSLQ